MQKGTIILGIDPGLTVTGYAVIHWNKPKIQLLSIGVLQLGKQEVDTSEKLKQIYHRVSGFLKEFHVNEMAIESPFYGKNIQVALKLGRTQGICIAAALALDIPISEYAPRKVKQSITGKGNASKEMVAGMLQNILKRNMEFDFLDSTDALAVAVCHAFQSATSILGKKSSSWKNFLENNPDKIVKR